MNNFIFGRVIKNNNNIKTLFYKKSKYFYLYKKKIFLYLKLKFFDLYNECKIGDYVCIRKTRPIKKNIFWILAKIIKKTIII